MDYARFKLEDFLKNDSFRQWVYEPTPEANALWKRFQEEHPDMQSMIDEARTMLLAIEQEAVSNYPDEEQVERIFAHVQDRIETIPIGQSRFAWPWLVAASVLLCLGLWFFQLNRTPTQYEQLVDQAAAPLLEKVNLSSAPLLVHLPDQSTVLLQPQSKISYAKEFNRQAKREVYLLGDAFFQVTKNPDKPFFVYANELVTKVLGTSFWVKATDVSKQVVVQVRTGKVSVFARNDSRANQMKANRELEGVVLTPNQQLAFSRSDVRMKKSLVDAPLPIQRNRFDFRDEPVTHIFSAIEEAYGIDIIYDEELLANCLLTASLDEEPLYEKLKLLCKGIEGKYEVVDAQIIISAKGCQ